MKTIKNFDIYISNLKNPKRKCSKKTMKKCIKPKSKSKQDIKICDEYVYKTPITKTKDNFYYGDNYIQISPTTMNLLTQNIFLFLKTNNYLKRNDRVEYYESICRMGDNYSIQSLKMKWKQYVSVEEYILNSKNININYIEKWLKQIFNVLDKLYKMIQFHHCDPKASQIFISIFYPKKLKITRDNKS